MFFLKYQVDYKYRGGDYKMSQIEIEENIPWSIPSLVDTNLKTNLINYDEYMYVVIIICSFIYCMKLLRSLAGSIKKQVS